MEKEKPPIFGMVQRGGQVAIRMLENVGQATIQPLIENTIASATLVYTDEYNIYDHLEEWGGVHKSVCYSAGEYAWDENSDGFHEVHVNTLVGFWSLLRSWLCPRPLRGLSQEKLPLYLSFFECLHNLRRWGKLAIPGLLILLLG
ncbi:transposase [Microbulbifer sp. JMSA003]|uniref:transposase n=1 Tax=Microbulbifer sp. JMSA003 TaxID=3243369 RepID=UPI00403A5B47